MSKVYLSAPIAKTVETEDGGREVWGFATLERVDKSGEIADFEGTVQAFEKWSSEVEKRTNGKSKGNVRVMHQPVVAGKTIHWEPSETTVAQEDGTEKTVKAIWVGAYVPPTKPDVIKDIDEGILSGLSIGGAYAKRWWDSAEKAFRFIPELSEYSLVDNPCVPGADIVNVIEKSVVPWGKSERNLGDTMEELEKKAPKGSYEELAQRIEDACKAKFTGPYRSWWDGYVVATFPDHVVVRDWDQDTYWDIPYTLDAEGCVVLGETTEVERVEEFVPIEAMKALEAEIEKRQAQKAEGKGGEVKNELTNEVTKTNQKGSEESMTAEEIAKAAEAAGLNLDQIQAFFKALTPNDQPTPVPTNVPTVDGDGDNDNNKEFPNPPEGSEKINIPAGIDGVKTAEGESGVTAKSGAEGAEQNPGNPVKESPFKADEGGDLVKAGKAISKANMLHLKHAANHIKAAMDGTPYGPEHHVIVENEHAGEGNTGEEAPPAAEKAFTSILQKSVGVFVSEEVTKTIEKFEALSKGLATGEALSKAMESFTKAVDTINTRLDAMEKMVKEIHETPQPGGPVLNGGSPDIALKFAKAAPNVDMSSLEEQALENFVKTTTDLLVRDRVGQELAIRRAKNALR